MSEQISEAFMCIADIAEAVGVIPLNKHPACWSHEFGGWSVKVNAHREDCEGVPPFHAIVSWEGMPTMLLWPDGGLRIGGGDAESDFIAACAAELARVREFPAVSNV